MGMSNAERQRRYRVRLAKNKPARVYIRVKGRPPSGPERWKAAVETLIELEGVYRAWYDSMPVTLRSGETGARLELLVELLDKTDLDELAAVEIPRGFGRDKVRAGDVT